jgi:hypothetical protein
VAQPLLMSSASACALPPGAQRQRILPRKRARPCHQFR